MENDNRYYLIQSPNLSAENPDNQKEESVL